MPSSTCWMTARCPVTVSTRASGQAPIAARSLRLVVTAATPAPYGSAAANEGRLLSPPTPKDMPASVTTAPSSPGPVSQSVLSKTSLTSPISDLAVTPGYDRTTSTRADTSTGIRTSLAGPGASAGPPMGYARTNAPARPPRHPDTDAPARPPRRPDTDAPPSAPRHPDTDAPASGPRHPCTDGPLPAPAILALKCRDIYHSVY